MHSNVKELVEGIYNHVAINYDDFIKEFKKQLDNEHRTLIQSTMRVLKGSIEHFSDEEKRYIDDFADIKGTELMIEETVEGIFKQVNVFGGDSDFLKEINDTLIYQDSNVIHNFMLMTSDIIEHYATKHENFYDKRNEDSLKWAQDIKSIGKLTQMWSGNIDAWSREVAIRSKDKGMSYV